MREGLTEAEVGGEDLSSVLELVNLERTDRIRRVLPPSAICFHLDDDLKEMDPTRTLQRSEVLGSSFDGVAGCLTEVRERDGRG